MTRPQSGQIREPPAGRRIDQRWSARGRGFEYRDGARPREGRRPDGLNLGPLAVGDGLDHRHDTPHRAGFVPGRREVYAHPNNPAVLADVALHRRIPRRFVTGQREESLAARRSIFRVDEVGHGHKEQLVLRVAGDTAQLRVGAQDLTGARIGQSPPDAVELEHSAVILVPPAEGANDRGQKLSGLALGHAQVGGTNGLRTTPHTGGDYQGGIRPYLPRHLEPLPTGEATVRDDYVDVSLSEPSTEAFEGIDMDHLARHTILYHRGVGQF